MIYLEETSQAIQTMLVMIIYHPSDPCICVMKVNDTNVVTIRHCSLVH